MRINMWGNPPKVTTLLHTPPFSRPTKIPLGASFQNRDVSGGSMMEMTVSSTSSRSKKLEVARLKKRPLPPDPFNSDTLRLQ
jgi:hypothetical protein